MKRVIPLLLFSLFLSACSWFSSPPQPKPNQVFTQVNLENLPGPVKEWADNSRDMDLAHAKVYQGKRYLLANFGQKPSGGYSIAITNVDITADKVVVTITRTQPQAENPLAGNPTYPQDIVYIENLDLPIQYRGAGESDYIMTLVGIDELEKIEVGSEGIKIFAPAPDDKVPETFTLRGVANVFEGQMNILLRDDKGEALGEGFAQAGMADWYYFTVQVKTPASLSEHFTLEIFNHSPKDNGVINLVRIPLKKE